MLNVSSPSPLYDDQNNSTNLDDYTKKNISMFYANDTSARPTLKNTGLNASNNSISNDENLIKFVYEFKIILIGPIAVGKTSILSRYISNEFNTDHRCTIKSDFKIKTVNINNSAQAKLNIWDTCGDEKFRSITKQYYRNAHGILLVYDITDRTSFENINIWAEDIKNNAPADCVVVLVGNKSDLTNKRVVSPQEGKKTADELGYLFNEVSAKNGDNIFLLFGNISEAIIEQLEKEKNYLNNENKNIKYLDELELVNKREVKKKKSCC